MNERIINVEVSLNTLIETNKQDISQADKNTHYINITFNDEIDLVGWQLLTYYKTPYPTKILVDVYNDVQKTMKLKIPNEALLRNGDVKVESGLQKNDELITVNKSLIIKVLSTINGTYLNADLGPNIQQTISEQLKAIQNLIGQADNKIVEYNTNANKKLESFNTNYNDKISSLDVTILNYIKEHSAELKGEKGDKGERGPQGIQGATGPQGVPGPAGTTDYNDLINKPDLSTYYQVNNLFTTNRGDLAIKLSSNNNQAQYEEWAKNNVRKIIFGFESGTNNDKFVFNGYNNTFLEMNGFRSVTMRPSYVDLGNSLRLGYGQDFANFSPEGDRTKKLRFFNNAIGNSAYFDLETLGTLSLDTNSTNNGRSFDITFKRSGNEKGRIGYVNGKMFVWNKSSNKTLEFKDNGHTIIPALNLGTNSKEIVGAINELLDRIRVLESK